MAQPTKLATLGGADAPAGFAEDLRCLLRLPAEARPKLWQVIEPCLAEELGKDAERLLDVFASAYRVAADDLARALKAVRFLVKTAVQCNVPAPTVADDVASLCPDAPWLAQLIAAGYEPLRAAFRREVMKAAVADHGNLLIGAQWRIDTIDASERGADLRVPVAVLTLQYREGTELRRITLQALPEMMLQLKKICGQIAP